MPIDDLRMLTDIFRRLGAREPQEWARSQIEEGVDQLARFVFLREAWARVVPADESAWIERVRAQALEDPTAPGAHAGAALERMLSSGASRSDLHDVVRVMQWELLSSICSLLDDSGQIERVEPALDGVGWELRRVDDDGEVGDVISGLTESVLETDPSGNEMRARSARAD